MTTATEIAKNFEAFSFGDPTPVLDGYDYLSMFEMQLMVDYYEPPVRPENLVKSLGANQHHASAIQVKRNILTSCFNSHQLLSTASFKTLVYSYLVFGNAYLERKKNRIGGKFPAKPVPTIPMRRMKDPDKFLQLLPGGAGRHEFEPGSILHLKMDDLRQEVYGEPEYLAALQSVLLNEAATLFRRKYYLNGSHAGFIMYLTDPNQTPADVARVREALKDAKGPGNFRNMFIFAPNGDKDGLKIIPIAEVAAKDEFFNIKNVTRDDVLAAHRVPPQLMGIVPNNVGGFGNVKDASAVFVRNELRVLQADFEAINDFLGEEVVTFDPYKIEELEESAAIAG